eukprot:17139_6
MILYDKRPSGLHTCIARCCFELCTMNRGGPEVFVLSDARHPIEVEAGLLQDVLECLLHHIIFHRALAGKAITPRDTILLDDIFYVKCGDSRIEKQVHESAQAACKALKMRDRGGAVTLTFYELS